MRLLLIPLMILLPGCLTTQQRAALAGLGISYAERRGYIGAEDARLARGAKAVLLPAVDVTSSK